MKRYKFRTYRRWKTPEVELLKKLYGRIPATKIAKHFGRTPDSVYAKARELNLTGIKKGSYSHLDDMVDRIEEFAAHEGDY